jgi:AcrR family transcriptional regulator
MPAKITTKSKRIGPGRLSAEATAELPARLLDAAMKLFSEQGFAATTMDQIAKEAGASTKTIYARYSNKTDILKEVVKRIVDRTIEGIQNQAPVEAADTTPRDFLLTLCTQVAVRISTEAGALNRMAFAESQHLPELKHMYADATATGAGMMKKAMEQWRARGLIPDLDPADFLQAAVLCHSMTTDWVRIRTAMGDAPNRAELDARVGFAVDLFLRGCGYRPEPGLTKRKPRKA